MHTKVRGLALAAVVVFGLAMTAPAAVRTA
jgi:hypothetical protein